jgi:hypothetical protein
VRFARLGKLRRLVLFQDAGSFVALLGVFHAASDPRKWRRRAKQV